MGSGSSLARQDQYGVNVGVGDSYYGTKRRGHNIGVGNDTLSTISGTDNLPTNRRNRGANIQTYEPGRHGASIKAGPNYGHPKGI